jgi:two-component system CheB/CheR fusion protein
MSWNRHAEDLWGVRADEARGRSILNLDIGLRVEELPVRSVLTGKTGSQRLSVEAVNRRGKTVSLDITCTQFSGSDERRGVVLLMEEK